MKGRFAPRLLRAFTLVELLIVVAIIAVLAALALPALDMARATSQRMKCASNLRQCGTAIHLWAADHNGCYIAAFGLVSTNGPAGPGQSAWYRRFSSLIDYTGGPEALQRISYCPTCASPLATATTAHHDYGFPYVANYYVMTSAQNAQGGYDSSAWVRESAVPHPANTVMLVDSKTGSNWGGYGFSDNSAFSRVGAPHNARTNVLWCDTHVSLELTTNLFTKLRLQ